MPSSTKDEQREKLDAYPLAPGLTGEVAPVGDSVLWSLSGSGVDRFSPEAERARQTLTTVAFVYLSAGPAPNAAYAESFLDELVGEEAKQAGTVVGRDPGTEQRRSGDAYEFLADVPAFGRALADDVQAARKEGRLPGWAEQLVRAPGLRPLLDRLREIGGQPADARRKRRARETEAAQERQCAASGVIAPPATDEPEADALPSGLASPEAHALLREVGAAASPRQRIALHAWAEGYPVAEAGLKAGLGRDWFRKFCHRLRG